MPSLTATGRLLALSLLCLLTCAAPAAAENQPPVFTNTPYPIVDVGHAYRHRAEASDPEAETVTFSMERGPGAASLDATTGELLWHATTADIGLTPLALRVEDAQGAWAEQATTLRVLEDFCPIYPIALPRDIVEPLQQGESVSGMERGTGAGNFSWLTWTGAVDAPTLATSLLPPGDSWTYVGPTDPADRLLDTGDWAQGAAGSMNASAVRTNLDALLQKDIVLPVWEQVRREGSNFDYLVWRFATVRLTDYRLTGNGWISFEFRGYASCHNDPPVALEQSVELLEDTSALITLAGEDRDGDLLTFELLSPPLQGSLAGEPPALTYIPVPDYNGPDSFTFRVFDGESWSGPAAVTIAVLPVNDPPQFTSQPVVHAISEVPYAYLATAIDIDAGDELVFSVLSGPEGLSVDADTGQVSWIPTRQQAGEHAVQLQVSDLAGATDEQTYVITVERGNEPPLITSVPDLLASEGQPYAYDIHAEDPDADALAYSIERGMPVMSVEPASGLLTWVADASLSRGHTDAHRWCEQPGGSESSQTPSADIITVVDRSGSMGDEQGWIPGIVPALEAHLLVRGVGTESPNRYGLVDFDDFPRAFDVAGARFGDYEALSDAARTLKTNGPAGHEDGWYALMYTLEQYPLRVEAARNIILITDEGRFPEDHGLTLELVQQTLIEHQITLNAVVNAEFQCGDGRSALGIDHTGAGFIADGTGGYLTCPGGRAVRGDHNTIIAYVQPALATGGAAWDLNYLRQGGAAAKSFSRALLDIKVREIARPFPAEPLADLFVERIEWHDGMHSATVVVGNRGLRAVPAGATVQVGASTADALVPLVTATLPELLPGTTHAISVPQVAEVIPQSAEALRATVSLPQGAPDCATENHDLWAPLLEVRASDPDGEWDGQRFALTVAESSDPPILSTPALAVAEADAAWQMQLQATDPDRGDALRYSLASAPAGMTLDPVSGLLAFRPHRSQIGTHDVAVVVSDLEGNLAEADFELEIREGAPPLRIISVPDRRAVRGETYRYQPVLEQGSAGQGFYLLGGPPGMTVDAATGEILWSVPAEEPFGEFVYVLLVVEDAEGNIDIQTFEVFADLPNGAPRISSVPKLDSTFRNSWSYDPEVVDPNFQETFQWRLDSPYPGFSVNTRTGALDVGWSMNMVLFPQTSPAADPFCRSPLSTGISLNHRTAWHLDAVSAPGQPIAVARPASSSTGIAVVAEMNTPAGRRWALVFVDGADGSALWMDAGHSYDRNIAPVAADLDGDGNDEIVALTTGGQPVAVDQSGSVLWESAFIFGAYRYGMPLAAGDLEGDGLDEVFVGGHVLSADGTRRWSFSLDRYAVSAPSAGMVLAEPAPGARQVAYFDQVRGPEGDLLWELQRTGERDGLLRVHWASANFDADPELEWAAVLVFSSEAGELRVLDADGSTLSSSRFTLHRNGYPVVADFDRDGGNEIYLPGYDAVLEPDGSEVWRSPVYADRATAVATDLDADGAFELVRIREGRLHMVAAGTGALHSSPSVNGSNAERMPLPINAGGEGALAVTTSTGLRAIAAAGQPWVPPAHLFGQREASGSTTGTASTLLAHEPGVLAEPLVDLWLGNLTLVESEDGEAVRVDVRNRGPGFSVNAVPLVFYAGDPLAGQVLHAADVTPPPPGRTVQVQTAWYPKDALHGEIVAVVEGPLAGDCQVVNDRASARLMDLAVTDHGGLEDGQRWLHRPGRPLDRPQFASTPVRTAAEFVPYRYAATVVDQQNGDRPQFWLSQAPAGATIDRATGVVDWIPSRGQAGQQAFAVSAISLGGLALSQTFTVAVEAAPNSAPVITSAPPSAARAGRPYRYQVEATDAEGDAVAFALAEGPPGMTVDATTGLLQWTADVAHDGASVTVTASDGELLDTQAFTIAVALDQGGPTITTTPPFLVRAGSTYSYSAAAVDPDGDPLAWSLQSAPEGASASPEGTVHWIPTAEQVGEHSLSLRVSDGISEVTQQWVVDVIPADAPPTVRVQVSPQPAMPGQPITISVYADAGATLTVTLDGEALELDPLGQVVIEIEEPGIHELIVTATSDEVVVTETVTVQVADPADADPPVVELLAPEHDEEVTAPIAVTGTVQDSSLSRWSLAFQDRNGGPIVELATGNSPFDASEIARFDPTRLMNGQYLLVLQAWDTAGRHAFDSRPVRVTGDLKLGHFSITFEDVSIPLAGIPVVVTRTYDTRRRLESLDFGQGWSVDYQNVRVHESRRLGFGWTLHRKELGALDEYCLLPNGDPVVTVTLPDGEVLSFRALVADECRIVPFNIASVIFEPIDGTDATLSSSDYGNVNHVNGNLVDISDPELRPIDPSGYRLATPEGMVYQLDQRFGIRSISEPNGQSVTYSEDGILHSSGTGVNFERDAAGRIVRILLPDGEAHEYEYTDAGDLDLHRDQAGGEARFAYDERLPHYLGDIIDPRGVRVSRNEYDDQGKLVATIDADGHRIEYSHDLDGRTSIVKDRRGNRTIYVYDDRGRVLAETNALDETTERTYNEEGYELTRRDPDGAFWEWAYDERGNRLTETNPEDETTTWTYNPQNQLLTQVDHSGATVVRNTYRDHGLNLLTTEDGLGNTTEFRYDLGPGTSGTGQVDLIATPVGGTSFAYAAFTTFLVSQTDAMGNLTHYTHDDMGRVLTETRTRTLPDGSTEALESRYTYDTKGRLVATIHPDGSTTTTEYDGNDRPVRECDGLQRCTETTYDARGNVVRMDYPDGSFEETSYDQNGNVLTETDREGHTTRHVYDLANRLVESIHPDATPDTDADNPRTRSVYDSAGRLTRSIDENGRATVYTYDAAGRQVAVSAPAVDGAPMAVTTTEYDTSGRRSALVDPEGHRTEYHYDAAGRLVETVTEGIRMRTEYDAVGRKVAEVDAMGRRTEYAYDPLGRLVEVRLAAGTDEETATRYAYDEVGNKISQTDAEGRITRWEYDAMGREIARILPGGERETKVYNGAGELVEATDFNGETTRYAYDAVGRLVLTDFPDDPDHGFSYNGRGERIEAIDGRGSSTSRYDARGRVLQVHDADGGIIEYQYDPAGNLLARISPSQSLVYTYDARNRMLAVTRTIDGEAPHTTRYEYDQDGNRAAMVTGDSVRTEYTYDRLHRLTHMVKRTAAGALLAAMTYTVDASGMRTSAEESDALGPTRTVTWEYDGLKRLTRESIDHRDDAHDRTATWTYDRVGNRLTQSLSPLPPGEGGAAAPVEGPVTRYRYDSNDRLLEEITIGGTNPSATTLRYDANGNTISRTGPEGAVTFRWNDTNRPVEVGDFDGHTQYVYDTDGLRVRRTHAPSGETASTTWYLQDRNYASAQVIEQHESKATAEKQLTAIFTFANDLVGQTAYNGAQRVTRFFHSDGFGSTRWLTDAASSLTDSIAYDAFGNLLARDGTTQIAHLYRSERLDPLLGGYDLRARIYSMSTGRFLSSDAFSGFAIDPRSLNKYLYGNGDPVNNVDPSGYFAYTMSIGQAAMTVAALATVAAVSDAMINPLLPGMQVGANFADPTAKSALVIAARAGDPRVATRTRSPRFPIIVFGQDVAKAAEHYASAIGGKWLSPILQRKVPPHIWKPGLTSECRGKTGSGTGMDCDEYPFKATVEGGPQNYSFGRVSLLPVNSSQNQLAGALLFSKLFRPCGITAGPGRGSEFAVIASASVQKSFGVCGNGQVNP